MDKKQLTKKQLKKQLTTLTESKADIKSELKKAYQALKSLKSLLVGHKSGEATLSFSDLKKIKTAARHIEDIYEEMVDSEMSEKVKEKQNKVEEQELEKEEIIFKRNIGRIRDIKVKNNNGKIFLLTDQGSLWRITK